MKMGLIEGSKMSAISTVMPGNYPKENILQILYSLEWYIPVFWRNLLPLFSGYMNAQFLVLVYQTVWCYPCMTYAKWSIQFNSHPHIHHSELKIVVWFDFATGSFWWSVFLLKEWTHWLSALQRFGCEVLLVPVEANGWNQCNAGSMTMMWEPWLWQMGNSSRQVGVKYIVFRTFKSISARLFWSCTAEYVSHVFSFFFYFSSH